MSFFKTITAKPWEGDADAFKVAPGGGGATLGTKRTGLYVFMGVATALFSLITVAYYMRMKLGGWQMLDDPFILWPNTAILLIGSIIMQRASRLSRLGKLAQARRAFFAGGFAGFLFLGGQLFAWQDLMEMGFYANVNPSYAFFYVITGLHGLHLLGGLLAWGNALFKTLGNASTTDINASIQLCDTYWHFMLFAWVGLFALLQAT